MLLPSFTMNIRTVNEKESVCILETEITVIIRAVGCDVESHLVSWELQDLMCEVCVR